MSFTIDAKMSSSQLTTLHTCRLKWWFGYGKRYKPMARSEHLDLGTGIHEGLAAMYKTQADPIHVFNVWMDKQISAVLQMKDSGGDLVSRALENDVETLLESKRLGTYMLEQYIIHHQHERLEVLQVEKEVFKPIPGTDWDYHAVIDLLVRDSRRRKKIYVVDHKTFTRFYLQYLEKDHQFVSYVWAAQDLIDEPIAGVIYNGLRKQQPGSKSKLDMFERHTLDINAQQVKLFFRRLRDAHDLLTSGKFKVYPEPNSMSCGFCEFRDPCTLYMKGEDYQFLLDNLYVKKEDREVIE